MELGQLLASPLALPSIPKVIALVLTELNRQEPDPKNVSALLERDPVMTARLLRVANSAYFQHSNQIGSVTDALTLLGLIEVRDMTYAAALISSFRQVGGLAMQQFWRYSLDTAKLTRELDRSGKLKPWAFTAGLIHAIGELVMHLGMPQSMAKVDAKIPVFSTKRAAAEHEAFGYSYAQVGAGFARAWNLPTILVEALKHQHAPFERGGFEPLACLLHLAAWRCRAQEMGYSDDDLLKTYPAEVALALKMDMDTVLGRDPICWTTAQEAAAFS